MLKRRIVDPCERELDRLEAEYQKMMERFYVLVERNGRLRDKLREALNVLQADSRMEVATAILKEALIDEPNSSIVGADSRG